MLRTREQILEEIHSDWKLAHTFFSWSEMGQSRFLDMCTGVRGIKTTYDPFFKEYMNPEYAPERLSDFLSLVLEQKVKVLKVLPNDTTRITADSTLLITDIVVELQDGSVVNVEMQKIGYAFPGERAACYSSDLLLRQYKRIKSQSKSKSFHYREIKPVYTIILFEKSPAIFKEYKEHYIHRIKPQSDTGIELNLLQNFIFIPLDIFLEKYENLPMANKLDAWLLFFASDKPKDIISLIETYPEFKSMYDDIYTLCKSTEDVMGLFSPELYELDKGTVKFMMDEMQEEIDNLKVVREELKETNTELKETNAELKETNAELKETNAELQENNAQLKENNEDLLRKNEEQQAELKNLQNEIARLKEQLHS